ncbi:IS5 family transposase [Methylobacterium sp. J-088]|nr:IS5 family transposase [Methylobacterium sp. J-088]
MLSDAQWSELEPPVEACRPKARTPPQDLQRTLSAILWRHQNGAKWRAIPEDLGPWWRAARIFIRWSRAGRLGTAPQPRARAWAPARDGVPRRHDHTRAPEGGWCRQKGGSGAERDTREALGRSRGGYGTKACVIADGQGRAIAFQLAPGQAHELPDAVPLLDPLPGVPKWVVGDRGYTSHAFREHIWDRDARPAIPPRRHEAPVACPDWIYDNRNQVERLWARLKEWRAIATRYEKTAASFMGVLALAAALDGLKR